MCVCVCVCVCVRVRVCMCVCSDILCMHYIVENLSDMNTVSV